MTKKQVIRITKQFHFEAAHVLWGYDGLCKNIHGHSYILYVTLKGHAIEDDSDPKNGMLMDFSVLKSIINELIVHPMDHALLINQNSPHKELLNLTPFTEKLIALPYQPTCENMIADFASRIMERLPKDIELYSLKLHETATSFAEWFQDDNR